MDLRYSIAHLFTPRHSNNHRARLLHASSMVGYLLLFVAIQFFLGFVHRVNPNILGYATDVTVADLLDETNKQRVSQGLLPLELNEKLSNAARVKAEHMFANDYWAHNAPDGTSPWVFILGENYEYLVAGENLAKNFDNSGGVVDAWMLSPSHRENLLKDDYRDIGFAIVDGVLQGEETTLVVQMFGTEKGASLSRVDVNVPDAQAGEANAQEFKNKGEVAGIPAEVLVNDASAVKKRPLFDLFSVQRRVSLVMLLFLIAVLAVDGYFVYMHKTVRIAGRNWAHVIFLISALAIVYFAHAGTII